MSLLVQELLETLIFAEECGKLINPPCWKTGQVRRAKICPLIVWVAKNLVGNLLVPTSHSVVHGIPRSK